MPRSSPKDGAPRLSVIMPIFIALPSRGPRNRTYLSELEKGAGDRKVLTDIPRIPGGCKARIVPLSVLGNGTSHSVWVRGGRNR